MKKIKKIKENQQKKTKETQQYIEDLKRLQAEFENYMKRTEQEKQDIIEYGTHKLLSKILHITDNFENALKSIEKAEKKEDIISGINMIFKQLKKTLEEEGVKEMKSLNEIFDPSKHESIGYSKGEDNKIIEEIKKGYLFKEKILRPSIVKVGRKENKK